MESLHEAEIRAGRLLTRSEILNIVAGYEGVPDPDDLHSRGKEMSEGSAWRGNWLVRLYERVRERGYDSVTAFAEARPTASWADLADELGQDIAGVQIHDVMVDEAVRDHKVPRLVRGSLVRELWERLPDGWPPTLEEPHRIKVAMALGSWSACAPFKYQERVDRAGDILMANPPPSGWRPQGPDDELLRTLLPDEEA